MTRRKGAELCRNLIAAHRVMRIARLPADWQIAQVNEQNPKVFHSALLRRTDGPFPKD
jgi:hypothetical protein